MRAISVNCSTETASRSTVSSVRARRMCTAFVVGAALFAASTPARADDGAPIGGGGGDAVASTVATAEGAAAAQASAIASDVASAAASAVDSSPAQMPSMPQSGSGSGVPTGISTPGGSAGLAGNSSSTAQPPASAAPTTGAAPAVVAPPSSVVSAPQTTSAPPSARPDTKSAPAAALQSLATQYQENPGRYQPLNSLPISRAKVPIASLESVIKRSPFTRDSSSQKPRPTRLQKCLQNLPDAALRTACEDILSQLPAADVRAVAHAAVGVGSTHGNRSVPRPHERPHAGATLSVTTGSPAAASADHVVAQPAAPTLRPEDVAARTKLRAARPRSPEMAANDNVVQRPVVQRPVVPASRSPRPLSPTAPIRDAATADRVSQSLWSQFGFVLLLVGITSIALAITSLGAGGAAVTAVAARLRYGGPLLMALATRLRSKGLSAGRSGERPAPRAGIRYRD